MQFGLGAKRAIQRAGQKGRSALASNYTQFYEILRDPFYNAPNTTKSYIEKIIYLKRFFIARKNC